LLKRSQLLVGKTGGLAGREVERSAQDRRLVAGGQRRIGRDRIQSRLFAQIVVPTIADGHMANLIAQNDVQDFRPVPVTGRPQLGAQRRTCIQAACFQGTRHQRHPGQRIIPGFIRHLPQTIVCVVIAVAQALFPQIILQEAEVVGFFARHREPIPIIRVRHAIKAPDGVQGQIDGIEFDVRQRMHQYATASRRVDASGGHLGG